MWLPIPYGGSIHPCYSSLTDLKMGVASFESPLNVEAATKTSMRALMLNYRYKLVSWTRPLPSPALDVLHHQHGEGRVWPLWHGFRGTGRNVDMTNEISVVTCSFNYHIDGIPFSTSRSPGIELVSRDRNEVDTRRYPSCHISSSC